MNPNGYGCPLGLDLATLMVYHHVKSNMGCSKNILKYFKNTTSSIQLQRSEGVTYLQRNATLADAPKGIL